MPSRPLAAQSPPSHLLLIMRKVHFIMVAITFRFANWLSQSTHPEEAAEMLRQLARPVG